MDNINKHIGKKVLFDKIKCAISDMVKLSVSMKQKPYFCQCLENISLWLM